MINRFTYIGSAAVIAAFSMNPPEVKADPILTTEGKRYSAEDAERAELKVAQAAAIEASRPSTEKDHGDAPINVRDKRKVHAHNKLAEPIVFVSPTSTSVGALIKLKHEKE